MNRWIKVGLWLGKVGLPWLGKKLLTYGAKRWLEKVEKEEQGK